LEITRIKEEMNQLISKMAEEKGLPPDVGNVKAKTDMKQQSSRGY
jgi:SOS-response transcriptional repressor LexA